MARLKPSFELTLGALKSNNDNPVLGPAQLLIERDMDAACDSLRLRLSERGGVELGDVVELDLGHDGDNERTFTGSVVRLSPRTGATVVWALGKMHALTRTFTTRNFEQQSAGSIAHDLIGSAGLDADVVDDGPILPRFAVDQRRSAFQQLKQLADRLGYEMYTTRTGAVRFHALGSAAGLDAAGGGLGGAAASALGALAGAGLRFAFGQHLLDANASKALLPYSRVAVGGESPVSTQGDSTAHWLTTDDADLAGEAGSGDPCERRSDPVARTKDLADRFAAGRLNLIERSFHNLSFEVLGQPEVELGDSLDVIDAPDELENASGYVRAIRHVLGGVEGFTTRFTVSVGVPR